MNWDPLSDTADYAPMPPPGPMRTPTPSNPPVQVDLAARTHPGKLRPNNEDNFLVMRFGRFLETMFTSAPDGQVPKDFRNAGYGMARSRGMKRYRIRSAFGLPMVSAVIVGPRGSARVELVFRLRCRGDPTPCRYARGRRVLIH